MSYSVLGAIPVIMSAEKIRRFPAREIERSCGRFGRYLGAFYRAIDLGGLVSDAIADPRSTAMRLIPKAIFRRFYFRYEGPLVSVVVATRNNAGTIEDSLNSLLNQTHRNIEIIVIDDTSDDDSAGIIEVIARRDRRLTVIRNRHHLGTGRSRNLGLKAARGEYVTFHDGDDFSLPTRIEEQLTVFSNFPEKKLSLCNYVRINAKGRSLEINDRRVMKCIISMMFRRREVLERVGYFEDSSISEDSDFYERIKIEFGACEVLVFRTLYQALFRPHSSFFSEVKIESFDGRSVQYSRDDEAQAALVRLKERHQLMREGKLPVFVGCDD